MLDWNQIVYVEEYCVLVYLQEDYRKELKL